MSQHVPGASRKKPIHGKHPAFTQTNKDEPVKMSGVDCLPETQSKRTRVPIPRVPLRRRLTD